MLAVDQPPAVQHRLLHGGDEEAAVRADRGAEMRALPFELFRRRPRGVGKPQRGAVVVRDRQPKALRQESEPADGRRRFEFAQLLGLHERRLAGRPGDRAVGSERDVIDPAMLGVGRRVIATSPLASVATSLPSSPPVTMRSPSAAVARIAPPWTATRRGSPSGAANSSASSPSTNTAVRPRKCAANDGAARINGARAFDDGDGVVASVAHCRRPRRRSSRTLR